MQCSCSKREQLYFPRFNEDIILSKLNTFTDTFHSNGHARVVAIKMKDILLIFTLVVKTVTLVKKPGILKPFC